MRLVMIAALTVVGLSAAHAGPADRAPSVKPTPAKTAPSKAKAVKRPVKPVDASTAAAPHVYPPSARVHPPAYPLRSNSKSQAGTVHKNAAFDEVAGAGG